MDLVVGIAVLLVITHIIQILIIIIAALLDTNVINRYPILDKDSEKPHENNRMFDENP